MFVKNVAVTGFNFLLVKAADGTALTGATVTCKVSKDGAAQSTSAHAATELAGGEYTINFDAAEFNATTVGLLFTATSAIPVHFTIKTIVWNIDTANPPVNAAQINAVSTSSVTTVNANQGTTQPVNFTGTAGSALVKGDAIDWNSVAVTGMPMPTYTQPTGFLAATFPSGTIANQTNLTGGTITTATNLTTNNDKAGYAVSATGLDLYLIAGQTPSAALRHIGAAVCGKISGAGTGTEVFLDFGGGAALTVTVDASGNRSNVVYA